MECHGIEVDVIGVPCNYGQGKKGVEQGPRRIREAGIIGQLEELGLVANDKGDLDFEDYESDTFENMKKIKSVGEANRKLADAVEEVIKNKNFCVALGGDHCMAIGSIVGHARAQPDLGIIWVDAHADINPPLSSNSGNVHGMPLAFLTHELQRHIPEKVPGCDWIKPCISTSSLAYIGLRDVDEAENEIIKEFNIKAFTMKEVRELGLARVVAEAIQAVSPFNNRPIHLSFDIDALDPSAAPSTGTPVAGGLTLEEGVYIVKTIASTGKLQMIDIAEVNPELGSSEDQRQTLEAACEIVGACFRKGKKRQVAPDSSFRKL